MGSGSQRQEIPTHLEVEDRILFGLTLRQGIIALVGLSIGYMVFAQSGQFPWPTTNWGGHPPLALRIVVASIPPLLALAIAVIQPMGRPLEEWVFALMRYASLPKRCVWRPRGVVSIHQTPHGHDDGLIASAQRGQGLERDHTAPS